MQLGNVQVTNENVQAVQVREYRCGCDSNHDGMMMLAVKNDVADIVGDTDCDWFVGSMN